jgi:hypothetical protein
MSGHLNALTRCRIVVIGIVTSNLVRDKAVEIGRVMQNFGFARRVEFLLLRACICMHGSMQGHV